MGENEQRQKADEIYPQISVADMVKIIVMALEIPQESQEILHKRLIDKYKKRKIDIELYKT